MKLIGPMQKVSPASTRTNCLGGGEAWMRLRLLNDVIRTMDEET
jgi:hypothetical protein